MNTQDEERWAGVAIEVTPEMIEAGYAVLTVSGIADEYLEADKDTVSAIYRAMLALDHRHATPTL